MKTRAFLRRAMKREVPVTFRLSRKNYEELFLRVVEDFGVRFKLPAHGQKTAVFLLLLQREAQATRLARDAKSWEQKEMAFVTLTREQQETISNMEGELALHRQRTKQFEMENRRLRAVLGDVSTVIRDFEGQEEKSEGDELRALFTP